jgi:SAM-dependent methyltransferase
MADLFDMGLRAVRRDRAARTGPELFLLERAFEDGLERIESTGLQFERALLIGSPSPEWPLRLSALARQVEAVDPGPLFADRLGSSPIIEDRWDPPRRSFDLVLAVGTLDTVNDLPAALGLIARALRPGGLFLGAFPGADSLPQLRAAMRAADSISGAAAAHVHPRIEASAVSPLLTQAGLANPVVDVDRVTVSYPTLFRLIADLRAMGATNILNARPRFVGRTALAAAAAAFEAAGKDGRTSEIFEILNVAAWRPKER